MNNNNFKNPEVLAKIRYKLVVYWKDFSTYKNQGINSNVYYGRFYLPDNGLDKLKKIFHEKEPEIKHAYIFEAPFTYPQKERKEVLK